MSDITQTHRPVGAGLRGWIASPWAVIVLALLAVAALDPGRSTDQAIPSDVDHVSGKLISSLDPLKLGPRN